MLKDGDGNEKWKFIWKKMLQCKRILILKEGLLFVAENEWCHTGEMDGMQEENRTKCSEWVVFCNE